MKRYQSGMVYMLTSMLLVILIRGDRVKESIVLIFPLNKIVRIKLVRCDRIGDDVELS